jgi:PBP1b-binding outer membrane lipoprotein LpoB
MRTASLAAALVASALLAACSKPEPAAGAPTPEVSAVDTAKTTPDSTATVAAPADSTAMDSTMSGMSDSVPAVTPDSAATTDSTQKN